MTWDAMNHSQEVNGHSEGSASTSSRSRRSRTPRYVLSDRESKSNNITKTVRMRISPLTAFYRIMLENLIVTYMVKKLCFCGT
jgi:hypothetical protein